MRQSGKLSITLREIKLLYKIYFYKIEMFFKTMNRNLKVNKTSNSINMKI